MKPAGLQTAFARWLPASLSIRPPVHPPLASFSQSSSHRLANQQVVPHVTHEGEPSLLKRFTPDSDEKKKFQQLAHDLQQRSLELIKIENIQISSIEHDPSNHQTNKSKMQDNQDSSRAKVIRSRKKLRTVFEEDPEFKFDRKRGKKHIMAALKQSRLNPNNANLEKISLPTELDLSIRSGGRLEKILLTLPKPSPNSAEPEVTPTQPSPADSSHDQQLKPIDEFVTMYLGPLVWLNPQVDISLVYNQDQAQPKITFWTKVEQVDDGSSPSTDDKKSSVEIEIDESMNRSDILDLILNYIPTSNLNT